MKGMSLVPVRMMPDVDSAAVALCRRLADEARYELERSWINPHPDAVVTAARNYLIAAENWADSRREGA